MTAVGRNEPCPCGSGKKYKKCCMLKENVVDLDAFRQNRAEEGLRNEILRFATGERYKDEILEATAVYQSGDPGASMLMGEDHLQNIRFLDWFINEYVHPAQDKRTIDLFAEVRGKNLDEPQAELLEEWRASHLGAFEVESTEGGTLKLVDVFKEDASYSVEDESACEEVETGEIVVARITSCWGEKKLAGAPVILAAESKQKLIDSMNEQLEKYREDNPEADLQEYLSKNIHRLLSTAMLLASKAAG